MDLHGIIPPILTPFDVAGEVDPRALERLTRHLLGGGVHGIFVFGSTGEFAALTARDREVILDVVTGVVSGSVPVLAGIAETGTRRAVELARAARAGGADALVLTATYYHVTSQAEMLDHFRAVGAAVDLPLVAYDIPVLVKTKLAQETVLELAREGTIKGLKDSSGDQNNFRELLVRSRDSGLRLFTGSEQIVDAAILMGAHGAVPGLGNVEPRGYARLYEAARAGEVERARAIQDLLVELFRVTAYGSAGSSYSAAALSGFKAALVHRGVLANSRMAAPLTSLDAQAEARVGRWAEDIRARLEPLL